MHLEANAALGLLAALLWGGGDFAGSIAVKRGGSSIRSALTVVLVGHILSLSIVTALAVLLHDTLPHGAPVAWGIVGGAISAISLVAFYIALASGHMGSAAAVSGLLCAAVPALVSAFTEGAPGPRHLLGFVLAGAAIWLIASSGNGEHASRRAMTLSTLSGIGFGIYFVSLKYAATQGILYPMSAARIGSAGTAALCLLVLALRAKSTSETNFKVRDPEPGAPSMREADGWDLHATARTGKTTVIPLTLMLLPILLGATLDTGGNLSFLAATRLGRLDVAAVLASIYPASTILLAAILLKEKTTAQQKAGMLLALPAVILITL